MTSKRDETTIAADRVIPITGTRYGIAKIPHGWAIYERITSERKETKEKYDHWCEAQYPVNFHHAAEILVNRLGGDADSLAEMLQQISDERKRLEGVLADLITASWQQQRDK
jgi:hypothetical protein